MPQNYTEALKWLQKAADHGVAGAQFSLGDMYLDGLGVPQNYSEALKWFQKAADQGNTQAPANLGFMYEKGQGVPQNYAEALTWYRRGAEQGDGAAQNNLGIMYSNGRSVPQNYVQARMWLDIATSSSNASDENKKIAGEARKLISKQMTPLQIARAEELARTCKQSNYKQCGEPDSALAKKIERPALGRVSVIWSARLWRQRQDRLKTPVDAQTSTLRASVSVPLQKQGGTYVVPVLINKAITLNFIALLTAARLM